MTHSLSKCTMHWRTAGSHWHWKCWLKVAPMQATQANGTG